MNHALMPDTRQLGRSLRLWRSLRRLKQTVLPEFNRRAAEGDTAAQQSVKELLALGEKLAFAPPALKLS